MRHRKLHCAVLFAAACPTVAEPPTLKVERQQFMDLPDEMHVLGLQHLPNQRELAVFVPKGYVLLNLETNQFGRSGAERALLKSSNAGMANTDLIANLGALPLGLPGLVIIEPSESRRS